MKKMQGKVFPFHEFVLLIFYEEDTHENTD